MKIFIRLVKDRKSTRLNWSSDVCSSIFEHTDENIFENLSIKDAIKSLSDREREILMMRYYIGKTQTEVSDEIGISQAQVSRLEKNALKVIKEFLV